MYIMVAIFMSQRWARYYRDDKYYGAVDTNATEALDKAHKYSFLPRKRSMTLTGLVRLLIDQFLPDSHQHYLFENYRQMDVYRVPANVVPTYLQGRPRALIKHCLVRKTKSNKFTHDSIHLKDSPGSFEITKDSGAKYTVSFFFRNR